MKEVISVTEAARNFAECVNRAHYQNVTFVLLKNGVPFAQIMPVEEKKCTGRELAEALAKTPLSSKEAALWARDLKEARKALKPQRDKWK